MTYLNFRLRDLIIIGILFFSLQEINSQVPYSCSEAQNLCNFDQHYILIENPEFIVNMLPDQGCLEPHLSYFSNLLWYKFDFQSGGDFIFDIIPSNEMADFDFVVFRSENGSCENLNSVRCMFSGAIVGQGNESNAPCLGMTGLSFESTDSVELAGCLIGSDNYLAPLQVESGESIFLAIAAYNNLDSIDVIIQAGGTAELVCNSSSLGKTTLNDFIILPNPASDHLFIDYKSIKNYTLTYTIFNALGKSMISGTLNNQNKVDLTPLSNGIHFIRLSSDSKQLGISSFIKK